MRECPTCKRLVDGPFCPVDGAATTERGDEAGPADPGPRRRTDTVDITGPRSRRRSSARSGITDRRLKLPDGGVTAIHPPIGEEARFSGADTPAPPPADLPRAWDAPAPRRQARVAKETLFMVHDAETRVGAAELLASAAAQSEANEPAAPAFGARPAASTAPSAPSAIEVPASAPAAASWAAPHTDHNGPSEVPWARAGAPSNPFAAPTQAPPLSPSVTPTKTPAAPPAKPMGAHRAARMSGGWGDDLFGGVGKSQGEPAQPPPKVAVGPQVVTSEPRPHPIPVAPVVPMEATASEPDALADDRQGLISTVLVLALVGSVLYFGGQFAWEKLQGPTRPQRAIAPTVDVPAPPPPKDLGASGGLDDDEQGAEEAPLLIYRATLSKADHLGAKGKPLRRAWEVIVNDRDRVHRGKGDEGDTKDARFASKKGRSELARLLRARRLPDAVRAAIQEGTPTVEIEIWPDQATVRVVQP